MLDKNRLLTEMNHHRCPACEADLDEVSLPIFSVLNERGERIWTRCFLCSSYFDIGEYDIKQEVEHTRTRPYGIVESGIQLNEYKRLMFDTVLELLRYHTSAAPKSNLLDVGCSFGGFLLLARKEGYRVRGFDILPEAVDYTRAQGIPCDIASSITEIDMPRASQDIISVLDCNLYWPNQLKELHAICEKLRPGGHLVMRVVDKSWLLTIGLRLRKWAPRLGERVCKEALNDHRVSIPVRSFLHLLERENFEILYASPRGAIHSDRTRQLAKISFGIGYAVWLISRAYLAPGCLILARKKA